VKTILVIDGAENCAYDHFQATEDFFALLFPGEGQDIEFIEDFWERHAEDDLGARPVRKRDVNGIDGILFYGLLRKKIYYPNKRIAILTRQDAVGKAELSSVFADFPTLSFGVWRCLPRSFSSPNIPRGCGGVKPPLRRINPHTGSAIRAAHICLKASRDWQRSSQAFTAGNSPSRVGWPWA
jgi:hypothetical protein